MTPDKLKELKHLNERWANDPWFERGEKKEITDAVMDLLPEVLAHVKQLTVERNAALKAFRDLDVAYFLLKCRCEEMQWLIRDMHNGDGEHSDADVENALKHLSTDCGKGYHADSEWKPVMEALKDIRSRINSHGWGSCGAYRISHAQLYDSDLENINKALAHAERITGGGK